MRLSTILASTLAVFASAAPTFPDLNIKEVVNADDTLDSLSEYFNLLATRVQLAKVLTEAPICDVSKAQMPQGKSHLIAFEIQEAILTMPSPQSPTLAVRGPKSQARGRRPRHAKLHL